MKLGFVPDRRNLGGKQNIDQLQRNHLLALINARSVTSNMQAPKQHVDYAKRQNRTMPHAKNIGQITQEFREVYEAKRRVIELKKGGIDQTRPICFDRRNYIRNRTCIAKDIQTQDHLRNLNSLNKKLTHIDEQHSKNKQRILQSQQQSSSQHLHQQSQSTVNHDHSHFFSPKSLTRPSSAYSKNANNNQSKYSIDYLSAGITPTMSAQDILQNSYGYQQQGQAHNVRRKPPQSAKPAASREKLAIIPNNNFFSMDYSEMMAYDRSVIGAEGDAQQQQAARNDQFGGYQEELVEVDDDNEDDDDDEVGQIDQQYYQYDQNRNSNHAGEQQSYEENQEFYHPNTNPNKPYHSSYQDDRLNNNQSHTISSNYMMDVQQQQQQQQQQNLRVINSMTNLQPPKKTKQEIMEMIPKIPKSFAQHSQADPYTELRRQLLAVIMDCRLYDKKEIMGLAGMVKKKNSHLELNEIIVVCRHIVLRLYGDV